MTILTTRTNKWSSWPVAELTMVALRIGAGAVGALPPAIALAALDRVAYGHAMANYAIALLLLGPIDQYMIQGYLRGLVARAADGCGRRPEGAGCIPAYIAICLALFAAIGPWLGLQRIDIVLIAVLVIIAALCRLQERWFVAAGQPSAAIVLFYLAPPLVLSALILIARLFSRCDDFAIVSVAMILAYGGCALISLTMQEPDGRRLLIPRIPLTVEEWRDEIASAWQFILTGALSAATEQLPVILLRVFGFAGTIPAFEIARKLAAVPGVIYHALEFQLGTDIIHRAHVGELDAFRVSLRRLQWLTVSTGVLYFTAISGSLLVAAEWFPAVTKQIDLPVAFIVLSAAVVPIFTSTAGTVVIALRGEKWWTLGALVGLIAEVAIALGTVSVFGRLAIPMSMVARSLAINIVIVYGAVQMWRRNVGPAASRVETATFAPNLSATPGQ